METIKTNTATIISITASCGGSGCSVQPYILPYCLAA